MRSLSLGSLALLMSIGLPACNSDTSSVDGATQAIVDASVPVSAPPDLWTGPHLDLGPPTGTIDPHGGGGTVNLLSFTVFGDVRPPLPDDDIQYPTTTVTGVMKGMAQLEPEFAVGTGDYMFVELITSSAQAQLAKLQGAESNFPKPIFHTLGNHECNSFSDINCPNLNESTNIKQHMMTLVPWTPVPWFHFIVHTALGDAKFLFIAVNAWNDAQAAWLTQAVAIPTKYTFVIRHHPTPDAGKPSAAIGIAASDMILAKAPVTLFCFGHVHEYQRLTTNAFVAGNAGAPLDAGNYGWVAVEQHNTGNVTVTAYDLASGMPMDTWDITPDGKQAP